MFLLISVQGASKSSFTKRHTASRLRRLQRWRNNSKKKQKFINERITLCLRGFTLQFTFSIWVAKMRVRGNMTSQNQSRKPHSWQRRLMFRFRGILAPMRSSWRFQSLSPKWPAVHRWRNTSFGLHTCDFVFFPIPCPSSSCINSASLRSASKNFDFNRCFLLNALI